MGLFLVGGTLLSLSRNAHWFVRGWDFPRVQIAGFLFLVGGLYAGFFFVGLWYQWALLVAVGAALLWQLYRIFPYMRVAPETVKRVAAPASETTIRLVASNVLMENERHEHWRQVIRAADPDVILAVEVDEQWARAIEPLTDDYPYVVRQPQDNYYGMMLLSRLPLVEPEVTFIVQDDVPSIHTAVELPSGDRVWVHGVHPRPPEPLRGQDSTPRDAEVVIMGREIDEEGKPSIIMGDFNDVAWSRTSELFLKVSKLLDPRKGRGFFNSFNANSRWFRFPLDHIFHSNEFKMSELRLLEHVGSDHFPVLIELSYEPNGTVDQPEPEEDAADEQEAEEKIQEAEEEEGGVDRDPVNQSKVADRAASSQADASSSSPPSDT